MTQNQNSINKKVLSHLTKIKQKIIIFWFRRDLRLDDNCGLYRALKSGSPVLLVFIFDTNILDNLKDRSDARVTYIHNQLAKLNDILKAYKASLLILYGNPKVIWDELSLRLHIRSVYANHDYEPYAIQRDREIQMLLKIKNIDFLTFKDQVIYEKDEILTDSQKPYTIYSPYKRRWLNRIQKTNLNRFPSEKFLHNIWTGVEFPFPDLAEIGFKKSQINIPGNMPDPDIIARYDANRDFPARSATTRLGIHLRFGTLSLRSLVELGLHENETWLSELIWREFFMMILWHFPYVVNEPFKKQYSAIVWRNDSREFDLWCRGGTGYPMVDAGMRELNQTGFMHNRVRMITASFLTKHLLIDWQWGERYFAEKLLDFELASNNGNWQWAAGCGCDAAPYFRIFNPEIQLKKYDPNIEYIKKWIPEYGTNQYPSPMVDHKYARDRVLSVYKAALNKKKSFID